MSSLCAFLPWNRPKVLPWAILVCATLNVIFLGGKRRAFGSFVAIFHKETNISLTELNWIGDSYAAVGLMSSSLSVAIILYFNRNYGLFQFIGSLFVLASCIASAYVPNPHWLFLTHTLLHGIGSSLVISIVGLVVNEHFDKKHPYNLLAKTLVSGGSIASILFVTFFAYLIDQYTWRKAFIYLGIIYFIIVAAASIVFRRNEKIDEVIDSKRFSCNCEGIRPWQVPLLVLWFFDRVLTSVVTFGLLLNLIALDDTVHGDKTLVNSSVLTNLYAGGEASSYIIGAVITATTKTFFKNKLKYILLVTSAIACGSLFAFAFTEQYMISKEILIFIAGFTIGPSNAFSFPAGEELTRLPGHLAYPFNLGGMGFGMIISPLLTAMVVEKLNKQWFFIFQGGLLFIKIICLVFITLLLWLYYRKGLDLGYTIMQAPEGLEEIEPLSVNALGEDFKSIINEDSIMRY